MKTELRSVRLVVFATSFSLLCYEILLTRIFSILQWQSIASFVISLALLGFGASGTALTLCQRRIEKRLALYLQACLLLFPASLGLGLLVLGKVPFNPFEVGIDPSQWIYLSLFFVSLGIPFFFGAAVIGMALSHFPIGKTYFLNLAGSSLGAIAVILLSFLLHPLQILFFITAIALAAAALFSLNFRKGVWFSLLLGSALFTAGWGLFVPWVKIGQMSPYKPLSRALLLPHARIIAEGYSPLGLVQVVEAEGFHYSGDLSLLCPYQVPTQKAIFFDGDSPSAVIPFDGKVERIAYLNYLTSSLPYHLLSAEARERTLILGVGGGEGILKALFHGFVRIDGVEIHGKVIELMREQLAHFSGGIYLHPRVRIIPGEARGFLSSTRQKYDLIELSLMDSYAATASGARALNENYLYTVESIRDLWGHLTEKGAFAITRWNDTPPRGTLKMLNLCISALEGMKVQEIHRHLFCIRSMRTFTMVISRSPLSEHQIQAGKAFARARLFDLVHYPGIRPEEANRYIRTESPLYEEGARSLLSEERDSFVKNYPFDLSAPTDRRPYYYNFFQWKALPFLLQAGPQRIPFTEWGYFLLVICLLVAAGISFLLILLPLFFSSFPPPRGRLSVFLYFALLGIGYLFVEMPLIQKFILFLHHPTYSLSVILSSLLFFSGLGSHYSDRIFPTRSRILLSALIIVAILTLYSLLLDPMLQGTAAGGDGSKILLCILFLAPLGFFMGIPFPQGLSVVKARQAPLLPWAWGINGFFSVISVLLAHILAIRWGFPIVLLLAAGCYLGAATLSFRIGEASSKNPA
ncbi:MAG: SAM-dependent methyltransferase [candidate division NC10 bacterium]|nr:SAM-dependent methyltransferase [candidate division NC10 bacterium]